jgi:alpha-L-rhamnosidase
VKEHDYHLTTGNLCTKYLLEALSRYGHADVAYRIAAQRSYPGWGYMLANGATTLWERWENMTGSEMNSHNHPMMGSVSSWFFKCLAGIDAAEKTSGFQEILIRPSFLESLSWAEAEYESLYGTIRSFWKRSDHVLELEVTVPVNAYATIHLPANPGSRIAESGQELDRAEGVETVHHEPGMSIVRISSGNYRFRISGISLES